MHGGDEGHGLGGAGLRAPIAALQDRGQLPNGFYVLQRAQDVLNIFAGAIPPWLETQSRSPDVEQLVKLWVEEHDAEMSMAREEMQVLSQQLPAPFLAAPPKVEGVAEKMILQAISEQGSDVLIVGSKSSTPLGRLLVGSTCESVLNHGERHLRRILGDYFEYYHGSRTHLSLDRNAPVPRELEPPERGSVISIPMIGGLHHKYARRAA